MKKFMLILVMMAAAAPLYAAQGDLATFGIALGAGLAISLAALGGGIGHVSYTHLTLPTTLTV